MLSTTISKSDNATAEALPPDVVQAVLQGDGILELPCVVDQPYSRTVINDGDELDHAIMRAKQLVDLLDVIGGEGPSNLMWLAQQLAAELVGTIRLICKAPSKGGAQ